ncbi:protein-glutamate methylesterase/protein-glutamine glutaminase [Marinobacter adhaerens]|uniref:protein-glutamate methylesterase/protein-glutamine glutaminase n=1 Tax=Marinobacter adhaerens TaxID=1033846 RepID=UPI001E2FF706|nr:chemotaxis response regulator protein-glutamate methylesterase [Marinobacter adhaerens]MCD1646497.1 chemotaxis response regulator protein-glutamate methylesterase [Marinobacter adhaerens]
MASLAAPNVFIIDDSALVRQVLSEALRSENINVIGTASDPIFAKSKMEKNWPDVILLDMEMPRMDGLSFLKQVMNERPTPVIVCSTLTESGAKLTLDALSAGAVAVFEKSAHGVREGLNDLKARLVKAVREASSARPARRQVAHSIPHNAPPSSTQAVSYQTTDRVVAIGTSTGGTQALEAVLAALPPDAPGIVAVQHMPEKFTAAFAARLNSVCKIEVREARDGDRVHAGLALIAPGGRHMELVRSGAQYKVRIFDGPHVTRHKPSVDVLFRSVAKAAGQNSTGIIMTGMGDDGARGMKIMKECGAVTVAQDEASCVVFGMPKEAIKLGAVDIVTPLKQIPELVMRRTPGKEEPTRHSKTG